MKQSERKRHSFTVISWQLFILWAHSVGDITVIQVHWFGSQMLFPSSTEVWMGAPSAPHRLVGHIGPQFAIFQGHNDPICDIWYDGVCVCLS